MRCFEEMHLINSGRMKINKRVLCFILVLLAFLYSTASAQQIITDGNTATTLNTNATITDVSTTTITNNSAFNSFTRFNVDAGNTVNLIVPNDAENLVNLVHSEQSNINGILNSMKNGAVGGNVFIANPHGMVVGANGVINVGSLTAITPTVEFMNGFFTAPGTPDAVFVNNLLGGTAPINNNAVISIAGQINASDDVTIDAGGVTTSGNIYTDAYFSVLPATGDLVNLNSLEYVADGDQSNLMLHYGKISIKAQNEITHSGNIFAETISAISQNTDITVGAGSNMTAGTNVEISSPNNVIVDGNVTALSKYYTYDLLVNADNTVDLSSNIFASVASGTITVANLNNIETTGINILGNTTGDGNLTVHNGFADLNITNDSSNLLKLSHLNTAVSSKLKINNIGITENFDNVSVSFEEALPVSKEVNITNTTASNILLSGPITNKNGNVSILSGGNISTLYDHTLTASSDINITSTLNNASSYGIIIKEYYDLVAGRDINLQSLNSKGIEIQRRTTSTAGRNLSLNGPVLDLSANLEAGNDLTINPSAKLDLSYMNLTAGNLLTLNGGDIDQNGLVFLPYDVEAAALNSDFLAQNAPMNLTSSQGGISTGNFDHMMIGGAPLNPASITLVSKDDLRLQKDVTTAGDITLTSTEGQTMIETMSKISAGGNINMNSPGENCYIGNSSVIVAGNDFNLNSTGNRYTRLGSRSKITATRDINTFSTVEAIKLFYEGELNAGRDLNIDCADSFYHDGKLIAGNNINLSSDMVKILDNSITTAVNDFNLIINELEIDTALNNTTITANNAVFSRKTAGNFYIGDYGILNSTEIPVVNANNLVIGNHANTNSLTKSIFISHDITAHDCTSVVLSANEDILGGRATITSNANITLNAQNGQIGNPNHYININEGNTGLISANANNGIHLNETDGDMRLDSIESTNNGDIYLSADNGGIIDGTNSEQTNISGGDLCLKKQIDAPEYFFIGINGDATEYSSSGFIDYFLGVLKDKGENWSKMPDSNYRIFDDSQAPITKEDLLGTLEYFASMTENTDMLTIVYNGHGGGGDPAPEFGQPGNFNGYDDGVIDEFNGPEPLNRADEYLYLQDFPIFDDEFAGTLKDSKGTVVYLTDQCYGGGMFGGNADLDSIANTNGFDYYGLTSNVEGKLSWASGNAYNGYSFVGMIHQALLDTLTLENPRQRTMNSDAESGIEYHFVALDRAYNADGNVYLNEWHDAITKEGSYYAWYNTYTYHYPYTYLQFTNMNAEKLANNPILVQNWDDTRSYATINNVGNIDNSLKANLTGTVDILANNDINFETNGNMQLNQISSANESIKLVSNNNIVLSEGSNITAKKIVILEAANDAIINGTIKVLGDKHEFNLLVNADNTINNAGTLTAVKEGANITVNNFAIQNAVAIDITGNISGTGELISHNGSALLNITNNSNNNLILKNINNRINTQIIVNSNLVTENLDNLTVTFTPEYRAINIINNTNTDIITTGSMINQENAVNITNTGGNILNQGGTITANTLNMTANNGHIGSIDSYIKADANNSTVNMNALNNIYLDSIYGKNSFSLRSTGGSTYLKMHSNMLIPIAVKGPEPLQRPVLNLPEAIIEPETIDTEITMENIKINENPASINLPQEAIIDTETLAILDEAVNEYEIAINAGIMADVALDHAVIVLDKNNLTVDKTNQILESDVVIDDTYKKILKEYIN